MTVCGWVGPKCGSVITIGFTVMVRTRVRVRVTIRVWLGLSLGLRIVVASG